MASNPHTPDSKPPSAPARTDRQHWMAVLARATAADIATLLDTCAPAPAWQVLRGPESGLVMVRGRTGGGGEPFNLGEMTVTRCTVRTEEGQVGHAYVAGRDGNKTKLAALVDALLQGSSRASLIQQRVIEPLERGQRAQRETTARKAAATRVQFFSLASMRT